MRRLFLLILLVLVDGGIFVYFRLKPVKILNPLAANSPIYELNSVLAENALNTTVPIYLNPDTILASVAGVMVDFSPTKDFSKQVRALQLVLPKVKMDGSNVKEIDLRFNNVVLKY